MVSLGRVSVANGLMVSVLAFHSTKPSSNPVENYVFLLEENVLGKTEIRDRRSR